MYYWMIYNKSTGYLGTHESSYPPSDSSGKFDTNLLPSGFELVGLYNDTDNPMPSDFKAAFDNPAEYLYQNTAFVTNPNYATTQFNQTVASKKQELQTAMNATLNGGFVSKSTGHTYPSNLESQSNMQAALKLFELDTTKTTEMYETLDAGMVSHTQTELQNVFVEGGRWKNAQYAQLASLTGQVDTLASTSGTTVAQIQAVVWSEADYTGVTTSSTTTTA